MSSTSSSITSSSASPLQHSHSNHFFPVKLGCENYVVWTAQIVPYLEGHSMYGYVTSDISAPPSQIASLESTFTTAFLITNPAYTAWYQQDKLILNTLISTHIDATLSYVIGIKTSRDLWVTLECLFASDCQAHIGQIRYQLASLKNGALPVTEYFQKAQLLAQTLAAIDKPMKDSALTSYVLAGLPMEYDTL
jgi:hypothetical protein